MVLQARALCSSRILQHKRTTCDCGIQLQDVDMESTEFECGMNASVESVGVARTKCDTRSQASRSCQREELLRKALTKSRSCWHLLRFTHRFRLGDRLLVWHLVRYWVGQGFANNDPLRLAYVCHRSLLQMVSRFDFCCNGIASSFAETVERFFVTVNFVSFIEINRCAALLAHHQIHELFFKGCQKLLLPI